jgi:hypothetical protein
MLYVQLSCPYCGAKNLFKIEMEKGKKGGPIVGPFEQPCVTCETKIDLLRIALLTFRAKREESSNLPQRESAIT